MNKESDLIKENSNKIEQKEEIGVVGVWKCWNCGTVIEQVIHPYFPNMPDFCFDRKCNERILTPRFTFLKWKILK